MTARKKPAAARSGTATFGGNPPVRNPAPAKPAPTRTVTTASPTVKPPVTSAPNPQQLESAVDLMKSTLASWGLSDLVGAATGFLTQGMSADEVTLKLQQTPEYKARFSANEARQAAGLSVLSPAQYIALEDQYRTIGRQYGLPDGFYDSKSDTDAWIGADVSPTELADRAQIAQQAYLSAPQEFRDTWDKYYGAAGQGGAIAAILDPHTAEPIVQQMALSAEIGGTAAQQGLSVTKARATQFAQGGVTLAGARQAYQQIAQRLPTDTAVAARFGTQFGQTQEENASLLGDAKAANDQQRLYAEESAQFGGHAAMSQAANDSGTNY